MLNAKMDTEPATLKPAQTAQRLVEYAINKHRDRYESCFLKAFAAGVMLSFGNILLQVVSGGITLLHQELLTSNMLYFSMAVAKRAVPFWGLCLNWFIVYFGNLAGSLFTAAILVRYSGILSEPPYHDGVQAFVIKKAADPQWHEIFLRGIGCNWLVSIAMWQAAAASDTLSKIVGVWLPIMITPAEYISKSMFASLFGNIIGALFIGMPATYMYLSDYGAGGYRNAENGEASGSRGSSPIEIKEDHPDMKM
ncbi:hypothetical protein NP233_g4517 [Leucocoprinus birnbaumii]|uniref:Formate/nitrite transporter n=1 Tax=Leucocoprinus birnbaumii TaxID=56174 RepID=A0AAD5VY91_9AGAR|nr:hypothetical protein NP233_g4517 [Leucocoprinus birnbaumii]